MTCQYGNFEFGQGSCLPGNGFAFIVLGLSLKVLRVRALRMAQPSLELTTSIEMSDNFLEPFWVQMCMI